MSLTIKVVLPNERAVGQNVQVDLLAITGGIVGTYFTNPEGEVTFNSVRSGSYRIRIRGGGLVDKTTDSFYVDPYGVAPMQIVHVTPVESENAKVPGQPMVSAADLNIPGKAKKEFNKGNDALVAGETKKALEHYDKAVKIYPDYGMAYNNMGAAYMRDHDSSSAQEAFEKAVAVDPQLGTANANLARMDMINKKPSDAIPLLDRALASEPTSAEYLYLMSRAQLDSGHLDEAIKYAQRVHEQQEHSKFAVAHLVAATAYEAENKPLDARTEYELFLKESPNAPQVAQVRAALERLSAAAAVTPVK
jgi:tetratricopeptide (TPR) repeat protein